MREIVVVGLLILSDAMVRGQRPDLADILFTPVINTFLRVLKQMKAAPIYFAQIIPIRK